MISKRCLRHLRLLVDGSAINGHCSRIYARHGIRTMATVSEIPVHRRSNDFNGIEHLSTEANTSVVPAQHVTTTVYSFPAMEPLRFAYYPNSHLYLPLRKDVLHQAIVYEGNSHRQGTASTKHRTEVRGSRHKLRPQKGLGMARVGDRKSPTRVGGGVAHGPHPRDFSTKLPKKVYDLAWRTALSFRYRRGQLILVDKIRNAQVNEGWFLKQIFERNGWGKIDKRSLLIANERGNENKKIFKGMERIGEDGRILQASEVDVKDCLEQGRLIIEQAALERLLGEHESDVDTKYFSQHEEEVMLRQFGRL